jgi:DNA replication and repair protein RecF
VILTGANGSGKTNVLEALSLLVPGRGLRRAALPELQRRESGSPWAVAVEMMTASGPMRIGTGRDPEPAFNAEGATIERRVIVIDGKPVKSQQVLAAHIALTWVTPEMDRVLAEGPSARRKFLDRLVFSFDPAHAGRVNRYDKALRERMYLLREGGGDGAWFTALENTLAQTGVAIAAARRQMLAQLQVAITETTSVFPQADLALDGMPENLLDDKPALLVEDYMRAALALARKDDAASGTSSIGPHRTDLRVTHRANACPADLCSTGEQKALLVAIILAYVRTLIAARHIVPLLLLDDIAAHLDTIRREALFEEILDLGAQAWLTGNDPFQFAPLLQDAQHFEIEGGRVV